VLGGASRGGPHLVPALPSGHRWGVVQAEATQTTAGAGGMRARSPLVSLHRARKLRREVFDSLVAAGADRHDQAAHTKNDWYRSRRLLYDLRAGAACPRGCRG
jgi:hypothetical protein